MRIQLLIPVLILNGLASIALAQTTKQSLEPGVSPFGISASEASRRMFAQWAPQMSAIGIQYSRCFPGFPSIEPEEGKWKWDEVDRILDEAANNKMKLHGMLVYNVKWIPSKSGFPSTNMPAYATYVSTLVKHVNGKVRHWEVWNEPPNGTKGGTPEEYAKMVSTAYDAAHAADAEALVGLAGAVQPCELD